MSFATPSTLVPSNVVQAVSYDMGAAGTYVVPAGVTRLIAAIQAAGGPGGTAAEGGTGGAYAEVEFFVSPGDTFQYLAGAVGTASQFGGVIVECGKNGAANHDGGAIGAGLTGTTGVGSFAAATGAMRQSVPGGHGGNGALRPGAAGFSTYNQTGFGGGYTFGQNGTALSYARGGGGGDSFRGRGGNGSNALGVNGSAGVLGGGGGGATAPDLPGAGGPSKIWVTAYAY